MKFLSELKLLIEEDLKKQMGKQIINDHLWTCLIVDFLLIQFVIGPFTVCVWRGAWEFYDWSFYKIFQCCPFYIGLLCFSLGFVISVLVALSYKETDSLAKRAGTCQYFLVSRIYSMLRFLFALLYWKGVFDMLDVLYDKDWFVPHFSVALAACVLFIIGSFKSAAISPPLGVGLDVSDDYIFISTFYKTTREDPLYFRILDALCTTIVEVVSSVAFYGAWGTGKHFFGTRTNDDFLTIQKALIALCQAHLLSLMVFLSQFIYLYHHYKCNNQCYVREWQDLFYAIILIASLFATSSYIRGWWEIFDIIAIRLLPNYVALENIFSFLLGFSILIVMGTASYNHFGVAREVTRETDGILLPFFYLTYYLRNRDLDSKSKLFMTHDENFGLIAKFFNILTQIGRNRKG